MRVSSLVLLQSYLHARNKINRNKTIKWNYMEKLFGDDEIPLEKIRIVSHKPFVILSENILELYGP